MNKLLYSIFIFSLISVCYNLYTFTYKETKQTEFFCINTNTLYSLCSSDFEYFEYLQELEQKIYSKDTPKNNTQLGI